MMNPTFTCDRCKRILERDGEGIYHDQENIYGVPEEIHNEKCSYCDDCFEEFKSRWLHRYGQEFPYGMPESEVKKLVKK